MADTPDNPPAPDPKPEPQKEPWSYSASSFDSYIPPRPVPPASSLPLPGQPGWTPLPGEPGSIPAPHAPASAPGGTGAAPVTPVPYSPARPVAAAPPPRKKEKDEDDGNLAGVIDTIEAIIIALIVALTFRAFIVEAFVIPTGSMAPTLLGAHYKVICPKCGYEFDLETPLEYQLLAIGRGQYAMPDKPDPAAELGSNRRVLFGDTQIVCPNCRYVMAPGDLPQYLGPTDVDYRQGGALQRKPFVWADNGDRILVLKYLYSVMEPRRWDVIVFKEPGKGQTNYIKRLIGLPGDTVQIVNGDVFIQPRGTTRAEDRQIQRKPEEIQKNLWQLVYDNDFYPIDEGKARTNAAIAGWPDWIPPRWINPWEPDPAHLADWKKGPLMSYDGAGPGTLQFHPVPPGAPDTYPPYGLNTLGYNSDLHVDDTSGTNAEFAPRSIVGDLRLETLWTPQESAGRSITLTLGRPNNCFRVSWGPLGMEMDRFDPKSKDPNLATHWSKVDAQTVQIPGIGSGGAMMPAPEAGKSYALALNNVDHAVAFYVDGRKMMWFEEPWDAAQAIKDVQDYPVDWTNSWAPRPADWAQGQLNTMIQIDVGGRSDLSHLKLFRDLYYTQVSKEYEEHSGRPGTGVQDNPITLGDDEFFALGDNSRRSADSRLWAEVHPPLGDLGVRLGIVPRRYLLGKAFFVYWPAGFTPLDPRSDVPFLNDLPLVPNAGQMRIIR